MQNHLSAQLSNIVAKLMAFWEARQNASQLHITQAGPALRSAVRLTNGRSDALGAHASRKIRFPRRTTAATRKDPSPKATSGSFAQPLAGWSAR
jgi:hypothetical protein